MWPTVTNSCELACQHRWDAEGVGSTHTHTHGLLPDYRCCLSLLLHLPCLGPTSRNHSHWSNHYFLQYHRLTLHRHLHLDHRHHNDSLPLLQNLTHLPHHPPSLRSTRLSSSSLRNPSNAPLETGCGFPRHREGERHRLSGHRLFQQIFAVQGHRRNGPSSNPLMEVPRIPRLEQLVASTHRPWT